MTEVLRNPGLLLLLGALLVPLWPQRLRGAYLLALPVAALVLLWSLPLGNHGRVELFGLPLATLRLDQLSFVFALIFHIGALLAVIYAWQVKDAVQQTATLAYAGAAIGAVLAGDLLTLFLYWELTALTSVFLIWARRSDRAYRVGLRYLLIQVSSGLLLLAGAVLQQLQTGSLAFERFELDGLAAWLIFLAFGIKCAFPLLHNWLQDAYPEATATGTFVLSIYTTKMAVYALARGFPGTELLIWIGVVMALFPLLYAVIENELRRALAYILNNQLGFMVVGVGVGTPLALNGVAANAFAHIIYEGLLFMVLGAVLLRTGTVKATELGGLYRAMPWTAFFCIVGFLSIVSFPLLSGFVTKSMIFSATAKEGHLLPWLLLTMAATAVFFSFKLVFRVFFGPDSGRRAVEAPLSMRIAMGLAAALSMGIGVWPQSLYALLPYTADYAPYTTAHVINQLQLIAFAAAAFSILYHRGRYPTERAGHNLDSDWLYRRAAPLAWRGLTESLAQARAELQPAARAVMNWGRRALRPVESGAFAQAWSTSTMVWWAILLLGLSALVGLT